MYTSYIRKANGRRSHPPICISDKKIATEKRNFEPLRILPGVFQWRIEIYRAIGAVIKEKNMKRKKITGDVARKRAILSYKTRWF